MPFACIREGVPWRVRRSTRTSELLVAGTRGRGLPCKAEVRAPRRECPEFGTRNVRVCRDTVLQQYCTKRSFAYLVRDCLSRRAPNTSLLRSKFAVCVHKQHRCLFAFAFAFAFNLLSCALRHAKYATGLRKHSVSLRSRTSGSRRAPSPPSSVRNDGATLTTRGRHKDDYYANAIDTPHARRESLD
ncbi:hypothetical protein OH76DRAFT_61518 [Lentinus brumalis]|uniref:Uncharacterized protein n=1 Tax=Lentinus brumalis TaxID=2498619 RepID=A0A371DKE4_9APHY|nr:hypothetical protein OH76DRAFT_61518 [Polyporus brumalis]